MGSPQGLPHEGAGRSSAPKRATWPWICLGAAVLLFFAGCIGTVRSGNGSQQISSGDPKRVSAGDIRDAAILVGSVNGVDSRRVEIDVGNRALRVELANVGVGSMCSSELYGPLGKAIVELLPVGSSVTLVRTPDSAGSTRMGDAAFIHLGPPGEEATEKPYGRSVNEQVIAAGAGVMIPSIERYPDSPPPDQQLTQLRREVPAQAEPYLDGLAAADTAAWEQRLGAVGVCRANAEQDQYELDETRREMFGPDGEMGTDDDPNRSSRPKRDSGSDSPDYDAPDVDLPNFNMPGPFW